MPEYKHGTYGEFAESIGNAGTQSGTVAVYVGAAPVNLIRGYGKYVNTPVALANFGAVKRYMGYSDNWDSFDLCEAFHVHLNNADGNCGPIVAINVLNPDVHKKESETVVELSFVKGRATINSDTIILDTLEVLDKKEGADYSVDYDFAKGQVIITSIGEPITGKADAIFFEVDPSMLTKEDIIGGVTAGGEYTGLGCIKLMYQELSMTPDLIAAPKWGEHPAVYEALIVAGTKVNGHWEGFVCADLPLEAADGTAVDSIDVAKQWKADNGYDSERSKVFWPKSIDTSGRVYHDSVLAIWRTMLVDASHNGLPMETCSNKAIPVCKQYFGAKSKNRGFDEELANELNAVGITTTVYHGGQWVLWGPHTAAYKHNSVVDNRSIFDNSIRTMMYVLNSFHKEWALSTDKPMTRAMADTIKNREQEKAEARAAAGAFIGNPVVAFVESENSTESLVEGDFVWDFEGTPTPPWKSGTLRAAYTTAGFESYFGEVE